MLKIIGILISIGIICILVFFLIPSHKWTAYTGPGYCGEIESDARAIAAAIADYFSNPEHTDIKKSDIEEETFTDNPWTLTDDGDELVIQVIDKSEKCSENYQESSPEWDSGRYTFKILKKQVQ